MGEYKYRAASRVVAFIEVILAALTILGFVAILASAIYISAYEKDDFHMEEWLDAIAPGTGYANAVWGVWLYTLAIGIYTIFACVAAVKLIKATKVDADPIKALDRANFWRMIFLIFVISSCIDYAITAKWSHLVVTLIVAGVFVFPVWKYIEELEQVVNGLKDNRNAQGMQKV